MAFTTLAQHTSLVFFFESLQQVIYICAEGEVEKGCSLRHFGLWMPAARPDKDTAMVELSHIKNPQPPPLQTTEPVANIDQAFSLELCEANKLNVCWELWYLSQLRA